LGQNQPEDYEKQEQNHFNPGFWNTDKAISKVTGSSGGGICKHPFKEDPSDFCCFLSNGAPAWYGSKGKQQALQQDLPQEALLQLPEAPLQPLEAPVTSHQDLPSIHTYLDARSTNRKGSVILAHLNHIWK